METIEVLFDEKTGKLVIHYSGVASHDREHEITDQVVAAFKAQGYDVEIEHLHDQPKLPELDEAHVPHAHDHHHHE